MQKELKEANWGRSYPRTIIALESRLTLKRKNWGFRLIYDVYIEKDGIDELIGTCHVLERVSSGKQGGFVVKELTSKSSQLAKRLDDIQELVRTCL